MAESSLTTTGNIAFFERILVSLRVNLGTGQNTKILSFFSEDSSPSSSTSSAVNKKRIGMVGVQYTIVPGRVGEYCCATYFSLFIDPETHVKHRDDRRF